MRTLIVILFYFSLITVSFSQRTGSTRLDKSSEKLRGGKDNTILHQTIQSLDGRAVSIGETTSKTQGGKDGYIAIFNPMGQDLIEKRIGGKKDDIFNGILQLPDGTFLIGGSTKSKGDGKENAWLVQVDEMGELMQERIFNPASEMSFQAVVASEDGGAFLVGFYPDNKDAEIKLIKINNWTVEIDKNIALGGYVKNIKSAVSTQDGGIVLVGDTQKAKTIKGDDIWVLKLEKNGTVTPFNKRYGEANYLEQASQIIKTADNGFAITGMTNNSNGENMNAWLLKLDEAGNVQWQKSYGGKDIDFANSVVQTPDDRYYLVGKTLSHSADARTSQIYFVKIDASGTKLWEDNDGGKQDDWGSYITQLYDGSFLLTATTELSDNTNSWFYRFRAPDDNLDNINISDKSFRRSDWKVNSDSRYLEANKRTSLSVVFTNMTSSSVKNVQLKCKSAVKDIQLQNIVYLGNFRGNEAKMVNIPIKTGVGLDGSQYDLDMEIVVTNTTIEKFTYKVASKKALPQYVFIRTPPQYEQGLDGETTLKLTLENPTNALAQNIAVKIELPKGLKALSSTQFILPKPIEAGKTAEVIFKYKGEINTELGAEKPQIICSVLNKGILIHEIKVEHTPLSISGISNSLLVWVSPDEDKMDIQNIQVSKSLFDVELKSYTNEPVRKDNFKIFIDEKPINGVKMDVVDLSAPASQNNQFRQFYKAKIDLEAQKVYHIRVDLQTSKGIVSSRTLIVKYDPERPNLHVVSIGTTNPDLKYTSKDARNIASFFKNKPNTLFKKTQIIERTDSSKTDYKSIKRVFNDLTKNFENPESENKIEAKDYLLVFISSHGKTGDDKQYKLLPSDYNPSDGDLLAIDYQTDVIAKLDKIKCHKILFIDACHSGSTRGTKGSTQADALLKISKAATGTTIITSCQGDEQSYEDDTWQNGAFTKALLEAFSNQLCSDIEGQYSSDQNNDKIITIGETINFIKRRVPKMVALQKKGRLTEQNPILAASELDMDIPLVVLN